jgi:predicted nucleic acid-binding protein
LTLYVESNFLLEIVLGQEETAEAERLLAAAEAGNLRIAVPAISLSEPFGRITRMARDRRRLVTQLNEHLGQLERSSPHQREVDALRTVPDLFADISEPEGDRLLVTVERLLGAATLIDLTLPVFREALAYRVQYSLQVEDAIVLATVVDDLRTAAGKGMHLFANRNHKDFNQPGLVADLSRLGCTVVWRFTDTVAQLGV